LCWDQPILAAAPGIVVKVPEGHEDYADPRTKSPGEGPGNHVIIDHGNKEITLYAHLRKGSTRVKVGEDVLTGDPLGACGNSGGSTGPHLHFQLMDNVDIDKANGLPLVFHDYFAPVRHVTEGTILRGDFVLPGFTARN
jgi:murein DD-endopeptidase MepM/ murein hydrolase activator NlpD